MNKLLRLSAGSALALWLLGVAPLGAALIPVTSGLVGHFRADQGLYQNAAGTVVAHAGQAIGRWDNLAAGPGAAGALTQATTIAQPLLMPSLINGNRAIAFDGVNDWLQSNFAHTGAELDIFVVGRWGEKTQNDGFLSVNAAGSQDFNNDGSAVIGRNRTTALVGSYRRGELSSVAQPDTGDTFTFESRFTGTQNIVKVNGVEGNAVASSLIFNTATLNAGRRYNESYFQQIDLAEIVVFDRNLTPAERASVESYFATQWAGPPSIALPTGASRFYGGDGPLEGLDLEGNFQYAVNFGGPAITIGDANFTPHTATPGLSIPPPANPHNSTNPEFGVTPADNALETLTDTLVWGNPITMSLANLEVGAPYSLQLLFLDPLYRNANQREFNIEIEGQIVHFNFDTNEITGGWSAMPTMGAVYRHNFVATDDTLNIRLLAAVENPLINALTLEKLPEPSSIVICALGALLGAPVLRRMRRR